MKKYIVIICALFSSILWFTHYSFASSFEDLRHANTFTRAGVYLRVPFLGGLKNTHQDFFSYGIQFGAGRQFASDGLFKPRTELNARIIDLNFSGTGFKRLSLGQLNILSLHQGRLGLFKNDDGSTNMKNVGLVVGGIVVVGLSILVLSNGKREQPCVRVGTIWHGDMGVAICA